MPASRSIRIGSRGRRGSLVLVLPATLAAGLAWLGGPDAARAQQAGSGVFTEEAAASGLDFVHFNGMSGELYIVEEMSGGAALVDYDNDGDLDVFLIQGQMLGPGKKVAEATFPPRHPLPLTHRLYRNDLMPGSDGASGARFVDVTATANLEPGAYGMGVAAGDYDNDGWTDLYITCFGANQLLRNRGDGTFEEVTAKAGVGDSRWSATATFFDYDRDGWLDLFVGNYVDFSFATHKVCTLPAGGRDYCSPLAFDPVPDRLYRNRGDGTFADVSEKAGILAAYGNALGSVAADFDRDGWMDLYVANDMMANQLWMNQRDGTFVDEALLAGAALNRSGQAEASMGVVAADFDADGDDEIFLTHLTGETNTFYVNDGSGMFRDESLASGLGPPSLSLTGFGIASLDFDGDGWLDLLTVNGAVRKIEALVRSGDPYALHQRKQLFRNLGGGRFREIGDEAGAAFELSEVGRGAAAGDLDNDGDEDVVIVNSAGPVRLLINRFGQDRPWIGVRALAHASGRDAFGARVEVVRREGPVLIRRIHADGSYASAIDPRIVVGLGDSPAAAIRVGWPGGGTSEWRNPPSGRYLTLIEGGR